MKRIILAVVAALTLLLGASAAAADPDFGPGNSSKGPNDGKCHPPGQTVPPPLLTRQPPQRLPGRHQPPTSQFEFPPELLPGEAGALAGFGVGCLPGVLEAAAPVTTHPYEHTLHGAAFSRP